MAPQNARLPRRAEIERIVREVLAELSNETRRDTHGTPAVANKEELVVSSRVVSLSQIEGRLDGVTRLVVPRGAVITPAVRDEIRQRQIAIASRVAGAASSRSGPATLVLAAAEANFNLAALAGVLTGRDTAIKSLSSSCLTAAVDELCGLIAATGQLCVLISSQPAAAVCLANRQRGVRAVAAGCAASVAASQNVAPNLLVINPTGKSQFQLRQTIEAFARGGPRPCPAEFRERLS